MSVITKNYFDITPNIYKIMFKESSVISNTILENILNVDSGNYYYLNFYEFNMLIEKTADQNTSFSKLDWEFFNKLSLHKNKMCFLGYLDRDDDTFTPTEILYHIEVGKMGIYVRKKIINAFKDCGINLSAPSKSKHKTLTRFIIMT